MKKLLFALIFTGIFVSRSYAFELSVDLTNTGSVTVSTSPVTPTQILTNSQAAMRTWIMNNSTNTVYLVGPSTTSLTTAATFSISLTTGSFYLLGNSSSTFFTPDGFNDPYRGPMWAVTSGGGGTSILRFRAK